MIQSRNLEALANQLEEVDKKLMSEVGELHEYIAPHIYQGDLDYFQSIYIGNIQVDDGGEFSGGVLFNDLVTFVGGISVSGGESSAISTTGDISCANLTATTSIETVDVDCTNVEASADIHSGGDIVADGSIAVDGVVTVGETDYSAHTLTIEGTELGGTILASQDLSFSLVGLVQGSWSDGTGVYTVETTTNNIELVSTTISVQPYITYDSNTHKYTASADALDEDGNVITSSTADTNAVSGDEAFTDGAGSVTAEAHTTGSAKLSYNGKTGDWYEYKTKTNIGTNDKTVYW